MWNFALQPLKHISTAILPMTTKFGRLVNYHGKISTIRLHDLLWAPNFVGLWLSWADLTHKVTRPLDHVINCKNVCPLPQYLLPSYLAGWWHKWGTPNQNIWPFSSVFLWGQVTFQIPYIFTWSNGHQTWQGGDLTWETFTLKWFCKATWQVEYIILYFHLRKICEHQTRQGDDLPWQAPTLKVSHMIL